MKLTLLDCVQSNDTLQNLTNRNFSNFKVAYRISRIAKEVADQKEFCAKEEAKILKKYFKTDDNGELILNETKTQFIPKGETDEEKENNMKALNKEMDKLHSMEVELTSITKNISLSESDLVTITNPKEISVLSLFFDINLDEEDEDIPQSPASN